MLADCQFHFDRIPAEPMGDNLANVKRVFGF